MSTVRNGDTTNLGAEAMARSFDRAVPVASDNRVRLNEIAEVKSAGVKPVYLDPSDPFDAALIPIVETNRRKRSDYAFDGADPFTNFRTTSSLLGLTGFGAPESALFNILQKVARLQSLRKNGRMDSPSNESVTDSALDLAVYSIIFYALVLEKASNG